MKSQVPEENPFLLDPEPSTRGSEDGGPLALKLGGWEVRNSAALWLKRQARQVSPQMQKC